GIIRELVDADMLRIEKQGTHNHYHVNCTAPFPHPFLAHLPVSLMLAPVVAALTTASASPPRRVPPAGHGVMPTATQSVEEG
ncbi:MAG: hypothetical protein ACR2PL_04080, partial [Dehalococcoidia bacterium]